MDVGHSSIFWWGVYCIRPPEQRPSRQHAGCRTHIRSAQSCPQGAIPQQQRNVGTELHTPRANQTNYACIQSVDFIHTTKETPVLKSVRPRKPDGWLLNVLKNQNSETAASGKAFNNFPVVVKQSQHSYKDQASPQWTSSIHSMGSSDFMIGKKNKKSPHGFRRTLKCHQA